MSSYQIPVARLKLSTSTENLSPSDISIPSTTSTTGIMTTVASVTGLTTTITTTVTSPVATPCRSLPIRHVYFATPVSIWGVKFSGDKNQSVSGFLERVCELSIARNVSTDQLFVEDYDLFTGKSLIWYRDNCNFVRIFSCRFFMRLIDEHRVLMKLWAPMSQSCEACLVV